MAASWRASTGHIESIARLLKALNLTKSLVCLTVSKDGIHVQSLAASKTSATQLFIENGAFSTYSLETEPNPETEQEFETLEIVLSLRALITTLQMFAELAKLESVASNNQLAHCFFEFENNHFEVKFAHGTMSSVCDLTVYDNADVISDLPFNNEDVSLQAILPPNTVGGIVLDLQAINSKEVTINVTVDPPQLEFHGRGELASSEFILPNEPSVLEALVSEYDNSYTYDFANLAGSKDAIRAAERVSLRYDSNGTLSIQCLCRVGDNNAYIEFRALAKL